MRWIDSIVEGVRKVREAHAAQFAYDFDKIYHDIKKQEHKSGRTFVSYPAKRIKPIKRVGNG